VPVFSGLRAALPNWVALGASSWVEDTIQNGVKIEWLEPPTPFNCYEYPMDPAETAFRAAEIQRELDEGYVLELLDPKELYELVCISSAFVVHTAHKPRAVFDYKHPNQIQKVSSCKYETLQELAPTLRPDDALLEWDIQDAYLHLGRRTTCTWSSARSAACSCLLQCLLACGWRP